jgi:hypothetical protein
MRLGIGNPEPMVNGPRSKSETAETHRGEFIPAQARF